MILQITIPPPEPTQSFYALLAFALASLLAAGFVYVISKLISKVDDIAVVQGEHQLKHAVADEKFRNYDRELRDLKHDVEFVEDTLKDKIVKYKKLNPKNSESY